ncbi:MAG: hypothetical protein V8Q79_04235 [Christensenellales bacterium]
MQFDFSLFNTANLISSAALFLSIVNLALALRDRVQRRKRIRILDPLVYYSIQTGQAALCFDLTVENYSPIPISVAHVRVSEDKIHWFDCSLCPPIPDDTPAYNPARYGSPSAQITVLPAILPPYSAQRMQLWFQAPPSNTLIGNYCSRFLSSRLPNSPYRFYNRQKSKSENRWVVYLSFFSCGRSICTSLTVRDRNIPKDD